MKKGHLGAPAPGVPLQGTAKVTSVMWEWQIRRGILRAQGAVFGIMLLLFVAAFPSWATADTQGPGRVSDVSGTVKAGPSTPVSMVGITLQSTSGGPPQYTFTDSLGRFFFDQVHTGNYVILINVPGYAPVRKSLDVLSGPVLNLSIILTADSPRHSGSKVSSNDSGKVSVRQLLVPTRARNQYRKGLRSAARGKTDDAIRHWKKSINLFPQYADAYVQLSKVYAVRGDFAQATEAANHAIDIDGPRDDAYISLGYAYTQEKKFAEAEKAFTNAVRLSDTNWFSQYCLGKLMLGGKDPEGAYPHLLRASQLKPGSPDVQIALYNDLVMLGRAREALAKLNDFLNRFPNSPLAASAREKRKHLAKALGKSAH